MVVPPLTADTVTVSPTTAPGTVNWGTVELVTLSVDDDPVSVAGRRSGVPEPGAVESTVSTVDGPAADVLPEGSVNVAVVVQVPSVSVGRSQLAAGST